MSNEQELTQSQNIVPNQPTEILSKVQWSNLIKLQKQSGLSRLEFCQKHNITLNQFVYRKQQLEQSSLPSNTMLAKVLIHSENASKKQQTLAPQSITHFVYQWPTGAKLIIPNNANLGV